MKIININGPINAGKTTVSKILADQLRSSLFIEVDNLLSDDEQKAKGLNMQEGWQERLKRLKYIIEQEKQKQQYENIIFAYPLTEKTYTEWKQWEDETTKFININLAPQLEICLQNRGKRILNDQEKNRIKQMYQQGHHNSKFADLIIDNSIQTPLQTTQQILTFLQVKSK